MTGAQQGLLLAAILLIGFTISQYIQRRRRNNQHNHQAWATRMSTGRGGEPVTDTLV